MVAFNQHSCFLGHLHRVEPARSDGEGEPTELPDGVTHTLELLGVIIDQEPSAEVTAGLLVAQDGQDDVAGRDQALVLRAQEGGQQHRHAALHVESAASPDEPLGPLPLERRVSPPLVRRRDHVHVPVEEQRRRAAATPQASDEVRSPRRLGEHPGLDPRVVEQPIDVRDARGLVTGGVRGVELGEPLEQFRWTFVDPGHALAPSLQMGACHWGGA
jgi:hypothetical protein